MTWRRGRRNLQSFALQLHVLGKNVITLITFSMCVTPVAVHCANDFNQITCCRDSACRLWGVRKNVNLPLHGFFFLFSSPHPPALLAPGLACLAVRWCSSDTDSQLWGWNWNFPQVSSTGTVDDVHFPLQHDAGTVRLVCLLIKLYLLPSMLVFEKWNNVLSRKQLGLSAVTRFLQDSYCKKR